MEGSQMPTAQYVTKDTCRMKHRWANALITTITTVILSIFAALGWAVQVGIVSGDKADKALFKIETIEAKTDERHISIERSLNNIEMEQRRTSDRLDKFLNNLGGEG